MLPVTPLHAKLGLAAHRGDSATHPENTLAAFAAARTVADYVEFDVRVTADGAFVVMHDDRVDRTTNGSGYVADLTAAQITTLDAGQRFGAAFAGEWVPTAAEALAVIVAESAPMMEFKSGSVVQAVGLLEQVPWRTDGWVTHFNLNWLLQLKQRRPDLQVGWLGSGTLDSAMIERARAGGIGLVSWRHSDLDRATIERVGAAGLLLYAWTVNDPDRCAELRALGVDGVVVDAARSLASTRTFASPLGDLAEGDTFRLGAAAGRTVVLDSGALSRRRRKVGWFRESDGQTVGVGGALTWRIRADHEVSDLVARWTDAHGVEQSRRFEINGDPSGGGLSNLSARAYSADGDATAVVGWVTAGAAQSACLVRGVGPTLRAFGVEGAMARPEIRLFAEGRLRQRIAGAAAPAEVGTQMQAALGAFALAGGDAVFSGELPAGAHSAHLVAADGQPGVGLLEIYRAGGAALHNLSFRGWCAPKGNLVAGFVIEGAGSRTILVRGVGPGLRQFGIEQALADPWLRLFDSAGRVLAASDDWSADDDAGVVGRWLPQTGTPDLIRPGARDAAIVLNLPAGAYSVMMESTDETAGGIGLIEVYDLTALPEA